MKLSNLSIRSQLVALVIIFMLVLGSMSALALFHLGRSNQRLVEMFSSHLSPVEDLKTVSDGYAIEVVDTVHKVQHKAVSWAQGLDNVRATEIRIKKHWREYQDRRMTEEEENLVAEAEAFMSVADESISRLKKILVDQDPRALEQYSITELYDNIDPISFHLGKMVNFQHEKANLLFATSQADYLHMRNLRVVLLSIFTVLGTGLGFMVFQVVKRSLNRAQQAAQNMADGNLDMPIEVTGSEEVVPLLRALSVMQAKLVEQADQRWVKGHVSEITTALQQAETYTELGQVFLSRLSPLVLAGHAVFFVVNTEKRLQLLSTYGYKERKELSNLYEVGEGLVGQCALERSPITVTDPPADYIRISSGLGDGVPVNIVLLPVLHLDEVLGVLELAAFHHFTPREIALVDALVPMMAMNLEILQRKMRTQRLLEETQEQAQRMEKQAAQLEEQAVEMEAQQAELLDTEAWYRSIVESAPDGILVVNEAGVIVLCNTQVEQIFGYEPGELIGQKVEILVPDDIRANHPQNRARFMASQGYRPIESGMELRGRHKSGRVFPAEFGLSILPTRGSRGRCVAVSVRDVTLRKAAVPTTNTD